MLQHRLAYPFQEVNVLPSKGIKQGLGMFRILLPLAVIATLLYAPIFAGATTEVAGIEKANTVTGWDYVGNTVNCFKNKEFSIDGDCQPAGESLGLAIFAAVFVSGVAAVLGVLGLLPFVGRITSVITTIAGVVVIAAIAFYGLNQMNGDAGAAGIQWGSYLAGGGGLLTLISGLSGMRGR